MPKCVCKGAKLKCSFGEEPKEMTILPIGLSVQGNPVATAMDLIPFLNIPAFGKCKSPANPMNWKIVGPAPVFIPSSCIPLPIMLWNPAAEQTKIAGFPAMLETSKTMCIWAGSIEVDELAIKNVEVN